jgi:hypothetical protein
MVQQLTNISANFNSIAHVVLGKVRLRAAPPGNEIPWLMMSSQEILEYTPTFKRK